MNASPIPATVAPVSPPIPGGVFPDSAVGKQEFHQLMEQLASGDGSDANLVANARAKSITGDVPTPSKTSNDSYAEDLPAHSSAISSQGDLAASIPPQHGKREFAGISAAPNTKPKPTGKTSPTSNVPAKRADETPVAPVASSVAVQAPLEPTLPVSANVLSGTAQLFYVQPPKAASAISATVGASTDLCVIAPHPQAGLTSPMEQSVASNISTSAVGAFSFSSAHISASANVAASPLPAAVTDAPLPAGTKSKAKPQTSGKAASVAAPTSSLEAEADSDLKASPRIPYASPSTRETSASAAASGQAVSHSVVDSASGTARAHPNHAHSQATSEESNNPPVQGKGGDGDIIATVHDSSIATPSAVSTHPAALPGATAPAPVESAAQGVVLSQVSSSAPPIIASAPQSATPATTQASPQIQSNPMPAPPRMVDSGELRIGQNSSELKVSVQLPELGKVEVRAVTAHDVTTAHLTTFRNDATQILSTDRAGLEQALKSRDVILGSMDSHTQGQSAGQQRQQNSPPHDLFANGAAMDTTTAASTVIAEASSTGFLPDHSSISVRA